MFFGKSTTKLIRKLTGKHGYSSGILCMMTTNYGGDVVPIFEGMMTIIFKNEVVLGLMTNASTDRISLMKISTNIIEEQASLEEVEELIEIAAGYGYVVSTSDTFEKKRKLELATVTQLELKEDE